MSCGLCVYALASADAVGWQFGDGARAHATRYQAACAFSPAARLSSGGGRLSQDLQECTHDWIKVDGQVQKLAYGLVVHFVHASMSS